ncbi:MAG: DJ-1 family glyoxalase III [Prevotella sp.]
MAKVYEFLAEGFEEVEGLAPVDILRRGGVDIKTVSVTGSQWVESSHGVTFKADLQFEDISHFDDADMLILPGGMPGAVHLKEHKGLNELLQKHFKQGKRIGAICAGPMVLGNLGILKGKRATCYPGFEKYLEGAEYTGELITVDQNITTAKGPAAAFIFGFYILTQVTSMENAAKVKDGMLINELAALHI